MKKIILDIRSIRDREALYDAVTNVFDFPDYFGRNLDALYDCLTDIDTDTCVGLFLPAESLAFSDPAFMAYLRKFRRTFEDAEEENHHLCVIVC